MFSVLMNDAVWSMQVLKGEEVVPKGIFCHSSHGGTEISFTFMHCVVASLRSSSYKEKCLRPFFVHGNAEMHMHSECHLLALYSLSA